MVHCRTRRLQIVFTSGIMIGVALFRRFPNSKQRGQTHGRAARVESSFGLGTHRMTKPGNRR